MFLYSNKTKNFSNVHFDNKKHFNINLMIFRVFLAYLILIFYYNYIFNLTKCSCFLLKPLQIEHAFLFRFLYASLSLT